MSLFIPLILILGATDAKADVTPPMGTKRVSFAVQVVNQPDHPDWQAIVYPWSLSNGVPTASVGKLEDSGLLTLGRRIDGKPAFWMVPKAEFEQWRLAGKPADALMKGGSAVKCAGQISPVHSGVALGPSRVVHGYRITSVDASACSVERDRVAKDPSVVRVDGSGGGGPNSAAWCGTVAPTGVGLFALVPLWFRRRRHQRR